MAKKREKRVRKQVLKRRNALREEAKNEKVRERLAYLTRIRPTPIVNKDDSTLVRNHKVLDQMLAEHEALIKFREENKDKADDMVEDAKQQQSEYMKHFKEANGK